MNMPTVLEVLAWVAIVCLCVSTLSLMAIVFRLQDIVSELKAQRNATALRNALPRR